MITIAGEQLKVETRTLQAVFEQGILVSLKRKRDEREFIHCSSEGKTPLQLKYPGQDIVALGNEAGDRVTYLPINDFMVEIRVESWYGDGIILISEEQSSGELIVEPGGYSSRPGLRACRWTLPGIEPSLKLVAPFFQGVCLPLNDPLIKNTFWFWPHSWEAGLAILQGNDGGFWVHCQDERYRFKSLQVGAAEDACCLGFETEAYGPIDQNLSAGGIAWRINVYDGNWTVPAFRYRDWLDQSCKMSQKTRSEWAKDLRFAISWCPNDPGILDALAKRLDPKTVLLHIPGWRTDGYDQNYPTFVASPAGRAFIAKAQAMGYHAMPHFNAMDMDPTHPVYAYLRDFQYRSLETKKVEGWTYYENHVLPVPESNAARLRHQDKNTMVKIHPGLSMWRSILAENVRKAVNDLALDTVFLDITLCIWNLHNSVVEDQTPTEGIQKLTAHIGSLGKGLVVGGEGRNEITMREETVGQVHLFKSSGPSIEGLERAGGCPLSEFLFGRWCRSFGYSTLHGQTEDSGMRIKLQTSLGAMPTITISSAEEIEHPNPAVDEAIKLAAS